MLLVKVLLFNAFVTGPLNVMLLLPETVTMFGMETALERATVEPVMFWSVPPFKVNKPPARPPLLAVVVLSCNVPLTSVVPPPEVLVPLVMTVPTEPLPIVVRPV